MPKIVDHDERRRLLTDALWRVVRRDGARGISIQTVADEAGVSKSNVVYYFPSRGALLTAAVDEVNTRAEELTRRRTEPPISLEQAVATIVEVTVPLTAAQRRQAEVWLLLLDEGHADPELRETLHAFNRRIREGFEQGVRTLQEQGLIDPGREVATEAAALHALVDGLSIQVLTDPRTMPRDLVVGIVRNHLRSLARP